MQKATTLSEGFSNNSKYVMEVRGKEKPVSKHTPLPTALQSTTEVLLLHKDHYVSTFPPHSHGRPAVFWEAERNTHLGQAPRRTLWQWGHLWGPCSPMTSTHSRFLSAERNTERRFMWLQMSPCTERAPRKQKAFHSPPPLKPQDPTNSCDSIILGSSAQTQTGATPDTELMRYLIL